MDENETRATAPGAFIDALKVAGKPGYLGDHDVVENLLRELAGKLTDNPTVENLGLVAEEFSLIMQGQDGDYTPIPTFHTRGGMAQILADHLAVDPDQPFGDMARQVFFDFSLEILGSIRAAANGDDEKSATLFDAAIDRFTNIIIGAADTTHPTGVEPAA